MHGGNIMYNICDIHSHIIPQVDDGAIDLNMSIQMLRDAYNQGTRSIICTSHSYGDIMKYYENLNIVKEELKRQNINAALYSGCEIYCSDYNIDIIIKELHNNQLPTMNYTKYVLMEFSTDASISEIINCIEKIISNGFRVIIAHVERYKNLFINAEAINFLKNIGCLFQVNSYSLWDEKNGNIRAAAQWMLKEKFVSFVGSDAHQTIHRPYAIKNGINYILETCDVQYAKNICYENAKQILNIY